LTAFIAASDAELPYGVGLDGRLVHVSEVENGLACNCRCPRGTRRLISKQGPKTGWHFAHQADACAGAFESMVHNLGKQIIADEGTVQLPPLEFIEHGITIDIAPSCLVPFRDVAAEVRRDGYRPDIMGLAGLVRAEAGPVAIELFVTNKCDHEKA
jgi:competence protein CoiA